MKLFRIDEVISAEEGDDEDDEGSDIESGEEGDEASDDE